MTSSFLDTVTPLQTRVGYGTLGTNGRLGYEGKDIAVEGMPVEHALSTHPPARLLYHLGGSATRFRCRVALNDDVASSGSYADFAVVADGREVAVARGVGAGQPPRELVADLEGAQLLELLVTTGRWECCHALWIEPELEGAVNGHSPGKLEDCLGFTEIEVPPALPAAERCIATVVSPGYEDMLDDMLGSLLANGHCQDATAAGLHARDEPGLRAGHRQVSRGTRTLPAAAADHQRQQVDPLLGGAGRPGAPFPLPRRRHVRARRPDAVFRRPGRL